MAHLSRPTSSRLSGYLNLVQFTKWHSNYSLYITQTTPTAARTASTTFSLATTKGRHAVVRLMSKPHSPPRLLHKHHSWSPDMHRDEAWLRRKGRYSKGCRRSKSVTDEDLEELKGCIELGFGFNLPEIDPKLSDTFPALGFYYAVNKQYSNILSRSSSSSSSIGSVVSDSSDVETTSSIFDPGDGPEMVKTRLRQWAQAVACWVQQSSSR